MDAIEIGEKTITYDIIRTDRKTVGITIDQDQNIEIRSPRRLSNKEIQDVVQKKAGWILEKLDLIAEIKPKPAPKEFMSGEKLPYLGRRYRLKVQDKDIKGVEVNLYQGKFYIDVGRDVEDSQRRERIRRTLISWYRERAEVKVKERIEKYAKVVGRKPAGFRIKGQKTLWGSCSSKGNLNFNWKVIMASMSIVDYVVVHELVHLIYPQHSKHFWGLVEAVIPDYKERMEWLRVNGRMLDF